ncbi:MAG: hypothetical protein K6E34_06945 [Lachnospiraceae bacterium]|nr:hypothetical protein [Lachnospiraceae bacterium]
MMAAGKSPIIHKTVYQDQIITERRNKKMRKTGEFDPKWKDKSCEIDPLAKLTREAREKGMSYGQYQAYLLSKSIAHGSNTQKQ